MRLHDPDLPTCHWVLPVTRAHACLAPRCVSVPFNDCNPKRPNTDLRTLTWELPDELHGALFAADIEVSKEYPDLRNNLNWSNVKQDITYVSTCDLCQKKMLYKQRSEALIQLLPVHQYPWKVTTMDFVTCLPKGSGFNSIIVKLWYAILPDSSLYSFQDHFRCWWDNKMDFPRPSSVTETPSSPQSSEKTRPMPMPNIPNSWALQENSGSSRPLIWCFWKEILSRSLQSLSPSCLAPTKFYPGFLTWPIAWSSNLTKAFT